MALILPNTKVPVVRHPIALPVSKFYAFGDAAGATATLPDLMGEIQPVSRDTALQWLCALSKAILKDDAMSTPFQLHLARQLFSQEWCDKIHRMMEDDAENAGCIFHRRAIWLVLQLSLVSCGQAAEAITGEDAVKRLARACLMASDILNDIDADFQSRLDNDSPVEWMIAVLVPMVDSAAARIDFESMGRAWLLWQEAEQSVEFKRELSALGLPAFEDAFRQKYNLSFHQFLQFLWAVSVRFVGSQLEPNLNPLLFDLATDEVGKAFADEVRERAMPLVSQTPEELAIRLLRNRQSWSFDLTPLRDRPLLESSPGKYCCPDLTIFISAFIDRVYFLLEDAYGKDKFRQLMGKLFECYIHRLVQGFAVTTGALKTYLARPRFIGSKDEVADGILVGTRSAAVMEYKAGLLTTRQRLAGMPDELFRGIESLASKSTGHGRKGVAQLAHNIPRLLHSDPKVISEGATCDFSALQTIYPVLVCFEESLGIHAAQKWLQGKFDAELAKAGVSGNRIGPMMLLTVRDFETLSTAAQSVSVEEIFTEYATHLTSQPRDYTGTFTGFVRHVFGKSVKWTNSLPARKHVEVLNTLMRERFDAPREATQTQEAG